MATRANVSASYISRLEDGYTNPKLSELQQVAKALGVPLAVIVGDTTSDEMTKRINAHPALAREIGALVDHYDWSDETQRAIVDNLLGSVVRVLQQNGKPSAGCGLPGHVTECQCHLNAKNNKDLNMVCVPA